MAANLSDTLGSIADRIINPSPNGFRQRFFGLTTQQPNQPQQRNPEEYDFSHKILFYGDNGAGKSSLILQFSDGVFSEDITHNVGMGVDSKTRTVPINNDLRTKLSVWDAENQSTTKAYPRGVDAAIVVFDVTNRQSFNNVTNYLKEICTYLSENTVITIVANKDDLPKSDWAVSEIEAIEFAEKTQRNLVFASAKNGDNVEKLFILTAECIAQKHTNKGDFTPSIIEPLSSGSGLSIKPAMR